jgi:hypothetical protein
MYRLDAFAVLNRKSLKNLGLRLSELVLKERTEKLHSNPKWRSTWLSKFILLFYFKLLMRMNGEMQIHIELLVPYWVGN